MLNLLVDINITFIYSFMFIYTATKIQKLRYNK